MEKLLFNLNFDDFHPQKASDKADFGGDMEKGLFKHIRRIIDDFPEVKITMFTTPNWTDLPDDSKPVKVIKHVLGMKYNHHWKNDPFNLEKHPEWVQWVNEYVDKGNLEIAVHGYTHHKEPSLRRHNSEFLDLSYSEANQTLEMAEKTFKKAGVKFVKGFRPPGWGYSEGLG